jgi:predicted ATP-grasp superfamily ATP-dependent carboligase
LPRFSEAVPEVLGGAAFNARYVGKRLVLAEKTMVTGLMEEKGFQYLYERGIRDIPRSATTIEEGQPICTVLAGGSTDRGCERRLNEKIANCFPVLQQILFPGVTRAKGG